MLDEKTIRRGGLATLALAFDQLRQHVKTAHKAVLMGASLPAVARHLRYILSLVSLLEAAFLAMMLAENEEPDEPLAEDSD